MCNNNLNFENGNSFIKNENKNFDVFFDVQEKNLNQMRLDEDIVFIHDPQPIGLVKRKKEFRKMENDSLTRLPSP